MWCTKKNTLLFYEILWVVKGFPFHVRFKQTGAEFFLGSNALWGAKPASNTDWKMPKKDQRSISPRKCAGDMFVCPFKVSTINTGKFGSKDCLYSSRTAWSTVASLSKPVLFECEFLPSLPHVCSSPSLKFLRSMTHTTEASYGGSWSRPIPENKQLDYSWLVG